eukprot:3116171-Pyramimonas_sp.AAC.2
MAPFWEASGKVWGAKRGRKCDAAFGGWLWTGGRAGTKRLTWGMSTTLTVNPLVKSPTRSSLEYFLSCSEMGKSLCNTDRIRFDRGRGRIRTLESSTYTSNELNKRRDPQIKPRATRFLVSLARVQAGIKSAIPRCRKRCYLICFPQILAEVRQREYNRLGGRVSSIRGPIRDPWCAATKGGFWTAENLQSHIGCAICGCDALPLVFWVVVVACILFQRGAAHHQSRERS